VFSSACTVAMETCKIDKMSRTCSPMIEHWFDAITVVSADKKVITYQTKNAKTCWQPSHLRKEKATHELIFPWLPLPAVLLMSVYE